MHTNSVRSELSVGDVLALTSEFVKGHTAQYTAQHIEISASGNPHALLLFTSTATTVDTAST